MTQANTFDVLSIFKAYDIRAKEENLTAQIKEQLIDSLVVYCKETLKVKKAVIGKDARLYVPYLADLACKKFSKAGIDVTINPLPISTCQFYYMCKVNIDCAGIMFTASHNPGNYVGAKVLAPGAAAISMGCGPEGGLEKIRSDFSNHRKAEDAQCPGTITEVDLVDEYIDFYMRLAGVEEGSLRGLKILMEFLNGSAGREMIRAFEKAGAELTVRHENPDGNFPCGDPNPLIESSIAPTRKAMREGNFDFGFCFDGDGDRIDVMNREGEQIMPGLNFAAILPFLKKIYGSRLTDVYADIKVAPSSICEMAKCGVNVHTIRNGHSLIKAKLREYCSRGYYAAVEESAHYYLNCPLDLSDFSKGFAAIESTLFFAFLTARAFKETAEVYNHMEEVAKHVFRTREWSFHCEENPGKVAEVLNKVEERMKSLGAMIMTSMEDGFDLDAQLMRFNLPEKIDIDTEIGNVKWVQMMQRFSRSEDAACKWEVASNSKSECERITEEINSIVESVIH